MISNDLIELANAIKTMDERIVDVRVEENTALRKVMIRVVLCQTTLTDQLLWVKEVAAFAREMVPLTVLVEVEVHPYESKAELDLMARVKSKVRALWGGVERGLWYGNEGAGNSP